MTLDDATVSDVLSRILEHVRVRQDGGLTVAPPGRRALRHALEAAALDQALRDCELSRLGSELDHIAALAKQIRELATFRSGWLATAPQPEPVPDLRRADGSE